MLRKLVETWEIKGENPKYKTSTYGKMEMYFFPIPAAMYNKKPWK